VLGFASSEVLAPLTAHHQRYRSQGARETGSQGDREPATNETRLTGEDLRFILGLKLKSLRQEQGTTLRELAQRAGLSISYLSEIEKGKKYPKPEKLIDIAQALGVSFDELVSPQVDEELDPVKAVFSSDFLQGFPFELFGVKPEDLFGLATEHPERAAALIRALLDIGRTYDVQVEQFLLAALRSYQQMNANHFADLEEAAVRFRAAHGWPAGDTPESGALRAVLEGEYGYRLDFETLPEHPDLRGFRSIYLGGRPPKLLVNGRLMPSQQRFILAREVGYRYLGLKSRAVTSSWIRVESFDQVLNNFCASYFAGALLIDRDRLVADLRRLFALERWDGEEILACMRRYDATPEMFFHRLAELLPRLFGLDELFFMRFSEGGTGQYHLTKSLNISRVPVPHGVGQHETYCRRWPALRLLRQMREHPEGAAAGPPGPLVAAQRSQFLDADVEFFVIATARPLALTSGANSSVSLGLLLDDNFKRTVRFWDDPAVPRVLVNLTCERCPLTANECPERAAPPAVYLHLADQARKEHALDQLLSQAR
jgi:transcriptional regulator with XRE-family HTH domain